MDVRGRIHRRFFGSRARRRTSVSTVAIATALGGAMAMTLIPAGAATTNGERIAFPATQCFATVGVLNLVQPTDLSVQAVVPNNVATSAAYSATIPGGTTQLPTVGAGFPISSFQDIKQVYLFRSSTGAPTITAAVPAGSAINNGNPIPYSASFTNEGSTTGVTGVTFSTAGGGTMTYTTSAPHNLVKNQLIDITGFGKAAYNASGTVVTGAPTTTTFTRSGVPLTITNAVWVGGQITYTIAASVGHLVKVGDTVQSFGSTPNGYNRNTAITAIPADNQITVAGPVTDPGPIVTKGTVNTLANPSGTGPTLGSISTLATATMSTPNANPGPLTAPDVTLSITAPSANSTVTSYGAFVGLIATLNVGDATTVCRLPHSDPQVDGISATVVGTGGPTTTSNPSCRPPDVCATTTTTLPAAPTVTSLSPTSGSTAGGTSVSITGTNLTGATAVDFGATNATSFTVNSATSITATAPAASAGTIDVTVTTAGGTSAINAGDQYTYVAGPTVTGVSPSSGPAAGGTSVTVTGTGLTGATGVSFGGTPAASFTVNNATQITATSPAHAAGTVDITVTAPAGTSPTSANDQFTFVAAPTVTGVSPSSGPAAGGTSVTVTGTGLTGATGVSFGGTPAASFTVNNATQITATSPAHAAGTVDITVTAPAGTSPTSANDQFTFVAAPTVTGVSPSSGPAAGGTSVTITGTGLTGATGVSFGGTPAASFTVNSATQITATSPAHAAGTVDITVTTVGGTSATSANDQFTFVAAPTVTGVSPSSGPAAGGTSVTITGTSLTGATGVSFGGTPAASFTVDSATQITATSPAHAAVTLDITVTTPAGTSATSANDEFTFVAAPTVSGVSPSSGPAAGGTSVTVTGTSLTGATGVSFGGTPAASFTVDSATQITATSPAHAAGTVDVTVTTPAGTSPTSVSDQFTFTATASTCGTACITVGDKSMLEMDRNHGQLIPVTLSQPSNVPVTVQYTVTSGSATGGTSPGSGVDFKTKTGTLTFNPGATSGVTGITKAIGVTVFGDADSESDETFTVTLSNPTGGYGIGPGTGTGACGATPGCSTGTILNDDGIAAGFTLGVGDGSIFGARSGNQTIKIPVSLSDKALTPITIDYTVVPGTATYSKKSTEGGDYGGKVSGTLIFNPGQTLKQVALPIWADAVAEPNQGFTITLTNLTGTGVTVIRATGNGTILGLT